MESISFVKIFLLVFFLLLFSCNNKNTQASIYLNEDRHTYNLSVAIPVQAAFRIQNTGDSVALFQLHVNNAFFSTTDDISQTIISMPNEYANEPLERKAWRFAYKNLTFNSALTQADWQHDPFILFNSLGFGQCDDFAFALCRLWQELGFKSRVWSLNGHLVSEVYANGYWQMYDATYAVYYLKDEKTPASVNDIAQNAHLVEDALTEQTFNPEIDIRVQFARYSSRVAQLYTSVEDNYIISAPVSGRNNQNTQHITLPPKSKLEFPILFDTIIPQTPLNMTVYAQAILTIPIGWTGIVEMPWVVTAILGKGEVAYKNEKLELPVNFFAQKAPFDIAWANKLEVIWSQSPIQVVYLVNQHFARLNKNNTVTISGTGIEHCKVNVFELPDSLKLNRQITPSINLKLAEISFMHFVKNNFLWQKHIQNISSIADIMETIRLFYNTNTALTATQQEQMIAKCEYAICEMLNSNNKIQIEVALVNVCRNGHFESLATLLPELPRHHLNYLTQCMTNTVNH